MQLVSDGRAEEVDVVREDEDDPDDESLEMLVRRWRRVERGGCGGGAARRGSRSGQTARRGNRRRWIQKRWKIDGYRSLSLSVGRFVRDPFAFWPTLLFRSYMCRMYDLGRCTYLFRV